MDRELIEEKLRQIQEETRKLIDDAYICGYQDGYLECTSHKGLAMTGAYLEYLEEKPRTKAVLSVNHI